MAKLTIVQPPEPQLVLELSLDEAAVLYRLLSATAGNAKETTRLYEALGNPIVIARANQKFVFAKGYNGQAHRIDIKD